jgi:hypothetical protein
VVWIERAPLNKADASVDYSQAAKEAASFALHIVADGEGFVKDNSRVAVASRPKS